MPGRDLAACRHWRRSVVLEGGVIGLYPARNAVVGLNPSAAAIWDALIETPDQGKAAQAYAARVPDRACLAKEDVAGCVDLWHAQGLLDLPKATGTGAAVPGVTGAEAWAWRRTLSVAGRPVELCVENGPLAAAIEDLTADFPPAPLPPERQLQALGPGNGWRICLDGAFHRRARDMVEARGMVVGELIRLMAPGSWTAVLHAAVLTRDGQTVLLTGRSGSGKSTLAAEMVSLGWKLVAEDCAAFDGRMRTTPIPFAFSFKAGAWPALQPAFPGLATARTHRIGPREIRYQSLPASARATKPVRPDLIVDIRFRPDLTADRHALRRLSPLETLQLFFNEESFIDFEADSEDAFLTFATQTPSFALHYGSSAAAHAAVTDCLRHPSAG